MYGTFSVNTTGVKFICDGLACKKGPLRVFGFVLPFLLMIIIYPYAYKED